MALTSKYRVRYFLGYKGILYKIDCIYNQVSCKRVYRHTVPTTVLWLWVPSTVPMRFYTLQDTHSVLPGKLARIP